MPKPTPRLDDIVHAFRTKYDTQINDPELLGFDLGRNWRRVGLAKEGDRLVGQMVKPYVATLPLRTAVRNRAYHTLVSNRCLGGIVSHGCGVLLNLARRLSVSTDYYDRATYYEALVYWLHAHVGEVAAWRFVNVSLLREVPKRLNVITSAGGRGKNIFAVIDPDQRGGDGASILRRWLLAAGAPAVPNIDFVWEPLASGCRLWLVIGSERVVSAQAHSKLMTWKAAATMAAQYFNLRDEQGALLESPFELATEI